MRLKIGHIAKVAHEANRAYCEALGDNSQVAYKDAPANIQESAEDGVRAVMDGRVSGPGDSHRNWLAFKEQDGWIYGPVKDAEKKTHPCMVPFEDLPADQRTKDILFVSVVAALLASGDVEA